MTEKNLFQTTLTTLGLTVLAPLFVGLTSIGAPNNMATNDTLKNYIGTAQTTNTVDNKNNNDNNQSNTASNGSDQSNQQNQNNAAGENNQANNAANSSSNQSNSAAPANAAAKAAGTYVIKDGDTYGCIAEKYYGSYDQWQRVYNANAGYPGFNEYDLAVGATLQMPAVSAAEVLPKTTVCQ